MKPIPLPLPGRAASASVPRPPLPPGTRFYLESYGCQMNVYDTEGMSTLLQENGLVRVDTPESADVLLVNTCSVREHAEERTLNRLAVFTQKKRERPDLVVGVTGCMAQRLGGEIRRRLPQLDFVVGARALPAVLDAVHDSLSGREMAGPYLSPEALDHYLPAPGRPVRQGTSLKGFITIIRGCNKGCAYCIVPTTRGPEVSRTPAEILDETRALVGRGAVEILLLGQNVNAYAAGGLDFADLLHAVGEVPGVRRLRFTTSHPRDMSEAVMRRIAGTPRLMPWLHLPVQSGSPRLLRAMRREYTLAHYRAVIGAARSAIADLALTTDIIVGFPGETAEDFAATVALLEEIRYDSLYVFKYSPRSGTPAARQADDVAPEEKQRRLAELLQIQRRISHEQNQQWVGRTTEVLVEGQDTRRGQWICRTGQNKTLLLPPEAEVAVGVFRRARIVRAEGQSLYGVLAADTAEPAS